MTKPAKQKSAGSSAHQRLLTLHRRVYRSLQQETEDLLGAQPEEIRAYQKQYQTDFRVSPARLSTISKAELVELIRQVDVTWIGDYHTYDQAQRTALRLAREVVRENEVWWLGVELVSSEYQAQLDLFQAGRMSEERFLESIHYKEAWGFPWRHYRPLFSWARQAGVRLIALNRPQAMLALRERRDLHERDAWAAGVITDLFYEALPKNLKPRMLVLYGEMHVARQHLPKQLEKISRAFLKKRALSSLTLHQNHDGLYFKLAQQGQLQGQDGVRLGPKTYCVFSGTPLAKAQSLLSWLEIEPPSGSENDASHGDSTTNATSFEDDEVESGADHHAWLRTQSQIIESFFELDSPEWDGLTLKEVQNEDDWLATLRKKDRSLARWLVRQNQRFYVPAAQLAYLGNPSQNGAAELACYHLLLSSHKGRGLFEASTEGYFRHTWQTAFAFLGSLLINPRRKCDLPRDHLRRISALNLGTTPLWPGELEARTLTLEMIEEERHGPDFDPERILKTGLKGGDTVAAVSVLWMSSLQLGRVLGRRVHDALLSRQLEAARVRELFFEAPRAITVDRFKSLYARIAAEARFVARNESKSQTL